MPSAKSLLVCLMTFLGLVAGRPPAALVSAREAREAIPLSEEGRRLARVLDSLDVESHWLPGKHIGDWETGVAAGKKGGPRTHCSLFVAAACRRLGVPMLEPPPQTFLSNRQQTWLRRQGQEKGWRQVKALAEAQRLANRGVVVVASYKNPNPKKAGHTAVVRPAEVSLASISKRGPRITQAGSTNYRDTDLRTGFKNHRGAWSNGKILFFAYLPAKREP